MKNFVSISLISLVVLASCQNRAGNQVAPPPAPVQVNTQPIANPVPSNTVSTAQPVQNNNVALNPKHGQPGHRCDIPEGSPLNSASANQPVNVQAQPQQQLTSPVISQPPVNKTAGQVKLNPAHGQPGHDCAIPVGQPLKN